MSSLDRLASTHPLATVPPRSPLRGRRYHEDRIYLLVRDPSSVLVVWELTPELHARAQGMARESQTPLRYQIRVERRTDPRAHSGGPAIPTHLATVDLPDALGGDRWYLQLPQPGGECRASLGIALPRGFQVFLTSGWVPVPPDGPCETEGSWELTAEARAWLLERAREGRGPGRGPGSAARYPAEALPGLAPPPAKLPEHEKR